MRWEVLAITPTSFSPSPLFIVLSCLLILLILIS
jgi:hypothetical protein